MGEPNHRPKLLSARDLTKDFRGRRVLSGVSLELTPGMVTGFLGANGAGKTTAIRMMLGLLPGAGETFFMGRPLTAWRDPARIVGAALGGIAGHPKHTVRSHLRMVAAGMGVPHVRVDEVLDRVGMREAEALHLGRLSLGMAQRIGIAQALLGDPRILILDEPANGLDPHSIHWLRNLLRSFADDGRAVLISSHQLAELGQLVDDIVVLARGQVIARKTIEDLGSAVHSRVTVQSPALDRLQPLVEGKGGTLRLVSEGNAEVTGLTRFQVGDLAAEHSLPLHWLGESQPTLEDFYLSVAEQEFKVQ
ncbi:ABC transporter ATP-binding protein [Streptomyces sp. NPDC001339]|uniref:ABC transporter ATP-binding protein n=1 Tax=Streptomyces sp. NPDC001339 TaxID=3364563 RepID=UPI0036B2AB90